MGPFTTNKAQVWANTQGHFFKNLTQSESLQVVGGGGGNVVFETKLPISGKVGIQQNFGDVLDVSGGASAMVPSLFYDLAIPQAETAGGNGMGSVKGWTIASPRKEVDEPIDGVECHVLSFREAGAKVRLWIGKQDGLVHQSRQERIAELPDFTDKQVAGWMAAVRGASAKPETSVVQMRQKLNEARRKVNATGKSVTVKFDVPPGQKGINSVTFEPPSSRIRTQKHFGFVLDGELPPAGFGP